MADAVHDLCVVVLFCTVWIGIPLWAASRDLHALRKLAQRGRE